MRRHTVIVLLLAGLSLAASQPAVAQTVTADSVATADMREARVDSTRTDGTEDDEAVSRQALFSGEAPTLRFERLNVEDGLSQISVYAIAQDHRGFMWFGMENGLNRYDGYTFKSYASIPFDTTSILPGVVFDIEVVRDGTLWIASAFQGVSRFDPATETATHYRHDPKDPSSLPEGTYNAVLEAHDGAIWVGTRQGLSRMDPSIPGRFTHYVHDPADSTSLSDNDVLSLFEDAAGAMWAFTSNGLNRMDPAVPGRFTRYLEGPLSFGSSLYNHNNSRIYEDPRAPGVLWVGSRRGLVRLDTETQTAEHYPPNPDEPVGNHVANVASDPVASGVLWASVHGRGIVRFDMETGTFNSYPHNPTNPHSLPDNDVTSIITDRAGIVWTGHLESGISRFDPTGVGFQVYKHDPSLLSGVHIYGIHEARDRRLWVSYFYGGTPYLERIDRATEDVMRWTGSREGPGPSLVTASPNGNVLDMIEDREGTLWLGTAGGLDRYDPATNRFTHYRSGDRTFELIDGDDGTFWVRARSGIDRFDPATGTSTRLWSGGVLSLFKDKEGMIWAGLGSEGIIRLDPATGEATDYQHTPTDTTTISSGHVFGMVERASEPGVLWIASSGGLNRLEVSTGLFAHFTTEDGLPDNSLNALLEDGEGMLWLSSNRGLARFDPDTEEVRVYGLADGLQGFEFHIRSAAKGRDGELFFGGVNGLNAFYPSQITGNQVPPQVALTGFRLFNVPVTVGPGSPLTRPLSETASITLAHHQNDLAFDYVALHFQNPEKNRYAYRLDGFDREWVEAGEQRAATYTNLPPGRYTFRVKAANSDGVWNEEGAAVQLRVLPPWWRTVWAYLGYGLLLVGGVVAADRMQRRRLLAQERERTRERELKQAREIEAAYKDLKEAKDRLVQQEKLASLGALTAGIAHEIKNPLNFVTNFAEVNEELAQELADELAGEADAEEVAALVADLKQNAGLIRHHGQRADSIVKSMMAHARTGGGERETVDLNAFVEEYVGLAYHGQRARAPDFNAEIVRDYDDEVGEVELVAQEMGRVLINLLGNAFDAVYEHSTKTYGPYDPKVEIVTRRANEHVEIRVADNGGGMSESVKAKVFEPFFTTKPTGQGTGLGLSMSHDIVTQGHGGGLEVESTLGDGTVFIITLPDSKTT